jgi:hypothetical protein
MLQQEEECFDFITGYQNILTKIIEPLKKLGSVKVEFETTSTCSQSDQRLVNLLVPYRYHFLHYKGNERD